jgi:hypothetical protein
LKSVALVARQPGTLNAFEILRKHLLRQGCRVEAFNLSAKESHADFVTVSDLRDFQNRISSDAGCLITGTSLDSEADSTFWAWARQHSIPSFAFIDQWVNLGARFEKAKTHPDHLLVPEKIIVPEIESLRLPSKIHVVGTPVWDVLRKLSRASKIPGLVTFATEPASMTGGQEAYRQLNGYDDMQSLELALKCLGNQPRADRKEWQFEIKLHPIDQLSRVQNALAQFEIPKNVRISFSEKNKKEMLEQSEFVFGNRSMLLVESSLVGAFVISFQPNRKTSSPATDREGIAVITNEAEFPAALRKALMNRPHLPQIFSCEVIYQLVRNCLS